MEAKNDTEKITASPNCKFSTAIDCEKQIWCSNCGWNPEVAAARVKKIRAEVRRVLHPVMTIGGDGDRGKGGSD